MYFFSNFQQAKDLQLALLLVVIVCMFFLTNLPRLLLNFYELFNVNEMIACGDKFIPPTWFICSTSLNHLLLVLNCMINFVVYCFLNENFRKILCGKKLIVNSNHRGGRTSFQSNGVIASNGNVNRDLIIDLVGTTAFIQQQTSDDSPNIIRKYIIRISNFEVRYFENVL